MTDDAPGLRAPRWQEVARVYLKIGTVGFGGGYAVLKLIQEELVAKRGWLSEQRYGNMLSLAELAPGALTVNLLAVIAYRLSGVRAMLVAVGALILLLAGALPAWQGVPVVAGVLEGMMHGVVPVVAALILSVAVSLDQEAVTRLILSVAVSLDQEAVTRVWHGLVLALTAVLAIKNRVPYWPLILGSMLVGVVLAGWHL